jgi:MFS superfamily sulfate permease-like transporter
VALMSLLALVVGCICVATAAVRLGFLASMLSKSVLVGYITGVGLTLLSSQIASFTGVPITSDKFFARFDELASELGEIDPPTVTMAICTLAVILVLRHLAPQVPGALVGVVVATIVAWVFAMERGARVSKQVT